LTKGRLEVGKVRLDSLPGVPVEVVPVAAFEVWPAQEGVDFQCEVTGQILVADLEVQWEVDVGVGEGGAGRGIDVDFEFDF